MAASQRHLEFFVGLAAKIQTKKIGKR